MENEVKKCCGLCDKRFFLDELEINYKWIDGLGYLCSNCMDLNDFSLDESNEVDEAEIMEDFDKMSFV